MSDRDCDNCAHHSEGGCSVWECSFERKKDDLISRRAAIDAVCMEWCGVKHQDCKHPFDVEKDDYYWCDGCETALRTLPDLPSAEPEIIRCKDCKYCEHWYADKGRCFLWHEDGISVFEDGFCNYAERRTDEHITE